MYIDASAIVALLLNEPDAASLKSQLDAATSRLTSPLTIFEASISLARARLGKMPTRKATPDEIRIAHGFVLEFVELNAIKEIPVATSLAHRAVEAAATYGKVVGQAADLNFGDCFAYACAKAYHAPLLFKGDDFTHTDVNDKFR